MSDDQITKEPETPIVKQKDPKKVAAGKKLAEYHKNAKKALEKNAEDAPTAGSWTPSLTTTLTIVGIVLTALDLYFRFKKPSTVAAAVIPPTEAPSRGGME